jgi:hypothetical protein
MSPPPGLRRQGGTILFVAFISHYTGWNKHLANGLQSS